MEVSPVQRGKHMLDLVHLTFASVYRQLTLVSNQSIMEYLKGHLRMTHSQFQREFTTKHRRLLQDNLIGDVILMYKLLQNVCGLAPYDHMTWVTRGDTLEFRLRKAKNLWTDLIHVMEHSPERVSSMCSELEELLVQIVSKVEEKTSKDLSDVRKHLMTEYIPEGLTNWEMYFPILGQILQVIFTMVFQQYNPDELRIKEYCFQNLVFNERTYKKTFLKMQREQIENYHSMEELDPIILYRVLERLIPREDVLHDLLRGMKEKRNEIVHMGCSYGDFESEMSAYTLFDQVMAILQEVGIRSGRNLYDVMAQMGKVLHRELAPPAGVAQPSSPPAGVAQPSSPPADASQPSSSPAGVAQPSSPPAGVAQPSSPPAGVAQPSSPGTVTSSCTVPSSSPGTAPSSITVPSSPGSVPSSTTVPSSPGTLPSSTTVLSSPGTVPSSITVPSSPGTVPSSTTVPSSPGTVPSSITVPSSPGTVPSSTTVPSSPGTVPPSTVVGTTWYTKEDTNVVRVFAALRRGGPAVKTFAKVFQELFPAGLDQLLDHCENVLGFTGKELKYLKKELKNPLEKGLKLTDLDLTCLYLCLRHVGLTKQEDWSKPSISLEHYLYLVKMKRNFLAHEVVRYTDKDLAQMAVDLPQWLMAILRLLGDRCGKDMSGMITDIKMELECIFKGHLPLEDIADYTRRIQNIRQALMTSVVARARTDIKKHYGGDRYRVVTPVTWCCHSSHANWNVNELYTELKIVDSSGFSVVTESVSNNNLFAMLRSTKRILVVEGGAGSGKTSLCKFAVHRWKDMSHEMDGLVDIDLLIFIQCRHVYSETLTTFLTQDLLKATFADVDHDDVIPSLGQARLLFVVDGFDEARPAARTLLHEALTKFPSSAFIITTRPEFTSNVAKAIEETTGSQKRILLRIVGFENTRREEYVLKLFTVFKGDPHPFLRHLEIIDRYLGSFTQLPLTLALLVLLWNDDVKTVSKATTVTAIYKEIVVFFQKRLVERQEKRPKEVRHCKVIERKIKKWLQALASIAWKSLQENMMSLCDDDEETLRDISDEYDIDSTDALSCLLQCDTTTTQFQCYENWEFIHKSLEEFLAASHLVSDILEENVSVAEALKLPQGLPEKLERTKSYSRLIEFLAGLLLEKNNMTEERAWEMLQLFEHQLPWTFDSIVNLSRECQSSSVFMMCLAKMFKQEVLLDYLEGFEPESLLGVLQETALRPPATLTIKISTSDAWKLTPLLELLLTRDCYPRVLLLGDDPHCIHQMIDTVRRLDDASRVDIIFEFTRNNSFPTLIQEWPWPKPLFVQFPRPVFPLLWLEFIACLALHSVTPSRMIHVGPRSADVVRALAQRLGIHYGPYTIGSPEEIIIIGQ